MSTVLCACGGGEELLTPTGDVDTISGRELPPHDTIAEIVTPDVVLDPGILFVGGGGASVDPATQVLRDTVTTFFDGRTSVEDALALLEDPARFAEVVSLMKSTRLGETLVASPQRASMMTSAECDRERLPSPCGVVEFVLTNAYNDSLPPMFQYLVQIDGQWKIETSSFCGVLTTARLECTDDGVLVTPTVPVAPPTSVPVTTTTIPTTTTPSETTVPTTPPVTPPPVPGTPTTLGGSSTVPRPPATTPSPVTPPPRPGG